MTDTIIIPDSIEPYLGYKALRAENNTLYSPQQNTPWPTLKPLVSACGGTHRKPTFSWQAVPAPPGWEGKTFWVPSDVLAEGTSTFLPWPKTDPPEGHTYIPVMEPHRLTGCTCGIYIVDTPNQCRSYMETTDTYICEIAGWGEVIRADRGVRAQYAYPQKIFAAEQQAEQAIKTAVNYKIPVEVVVFEA